MDNIRKILEMVVIPKVLREYQRTRKASGAFGKSLIIVKRGDKYYLNGYQYGEHLIYGRRPNKNQDPRAIKRFARGAGRTWAKKWVKNKGLTLNPYAVATNIAKKGYKGKDMLKVIETAGVRRELQEEIGLFVADVLTKDMERKLATI